MSNWEFRIRGYAGERHARRIPHGELLLETVHANESSAYVEIEAWKARMARYEVGRAELIDLRPMGKLTNMNVRPETDIPWSWRR